MLKPQNEGNRLDGFIGNSGRPAQRSTSDSGLGEWVAGMVARSSAKWAGAIAGWPVGLVNADAIRRDRPLAELRNETTMQSSRTGIAVNSAIVLVGAEPVGPGQEDGRPESVPRPRVSGSHPAAGGPRRRGPRAAGRRPRPTGTSAAPTSWPTSRRSPARSPAASAGSRSTCRSSRRLARSRASSARRSRSPPSPATACRPGC